MVRKYFKVIDYIDITVFGNKLLIHASKVGFIDFVKCLVSKGADISSRDGFPPTALRLAAENGHLKVVKYFVKKGINIHIRNNFVFKRAALYGRLEIIKYLVERPDCKKTILSLC